MSKYKSKLHPVLMRVLDAMFVFGIVLLVASYLLRENDRAIVDDNKPTVLDVPAKTSNLNDLPITQEIIGVAPVPPSDLLAAAESMAGKNASGKLIRRRIEVNGEDSVVYMEMDGAFIIPTKPFVGEIEGFNGPIHMALYLDADGVLLDMRVLEHKETKRYFRRVTQWLPKLNGHNLSREKLKSIDAVTGATYSSVAVIQTAQCAIRGFLEAVNKKKGEASFTLNKTGMLHFSSVSVPAKSSCMPSTNTHKPLLNVRADSIALILFCCAAVGMRFIRWRWPRRAFLLASVLILGFFYNRMYSTFEIFDLMSFAWLTEGIGMRHVIVILIPLIVLVFGNIFCGYVCPFGAMQDLVSDILPERFMLRLSKPTMRYLRCVKYFVLFACVVIYSISRSKDMLAIDPLQWVFDQPFNWMWTVGCIVPALFLRRYWCRIFCPTGAFLSLLNRLPLLGKMMPYIAPSRCDLGVESIHDIDCIRCDRCRMDETGGSLIFRDNE